MWTPLLLSSMGKALNGLFLSFQSVANLGGLGDLGMGGAINIQTSRLLGQGDEKELRSFLASARTLFLIMALLAMAIFLGLSPWLPNWLQFEESPGAGSLSLLFAVGSLSAGLLILNSYITNLNYGCSNLTWSVIPTFILIQLGTLGHWLLARNHLPLWAQYLPYVFVSILGLLMGWIYIRCSHPPLAHLRPLAFDTKQIRSLLGKSFWIYFYGIGAGINLTTDRLLINAGFGAERIPAYVYNYKLCELALFVVVSASFVSMPKITQWMASPSPSDRERAVLESERLNKFQTFLGCAAAVVYLAANDFFMAWWLGADYKIPFHWQAAFAANLAVTGAGYVGYDLAARCSDKGIRVGGIAVLMAALLNLILSFAAMKAGSIFGIAAATAFATSCLVLYLGWFVSKQLNVSWWRLSIKNWFLALAAVGLACSLKAFLNFDPAVNVTITVGIYVPALLLVARILGIHRSDLSREFNIIRAMFARSKGSSEH